MKRVIVACDGTWQNSDSGFLRTSWLPWKTGGRLDAPSNVTRICRALQPRAEDGTQQVLYYQAGIGTSSNWYSYYVGGFLGEGLSDNIREAYNFLCNNYEEGDEIIVIGFSRGAFTARSIVGLINAVGLLTKKGLSSFYCIFKDWENQVNGDYQPAYGTAAWPDSRPKFSDPSYVPKLDKAGLTRPNIPVKVVAVWDTVGCLGMPELTFFGVIHLLGKETKEYSFINTEVPSNVEYAYQAMALDEARKPYNTSVWESPKSGTETRLKQLKQTWFAGVHRGVGGGYEDTSTSDVTLAWMITQLSEHLTFDRDYIVRQQWQNQEFYSGKKQSPASYDSGLIFRSDAGAMGTAMGRIVRTPGEYYVIDPRTGNPTKTRLSNTCEFIRPSVRYRMQQNNTNVVDSKTGVPNAEYVPKPLKGWTYVPPNKPWRDDKSLIIGLEAEKWDGYGKWMVKKKDGSFTYIVEEKIEEGTDEMALLQAFSGVAAKVLT